MNRKIKNALIELAALVCISSDAFAQESEVNATLIQNVNFFMERVIRPPKV